MKLHDLLGYDDIVIQCHNNPDADAIVSGFALYSYLKSEGKNPRFVYGGHNVIRKTNLVMLINDLNIPIEHVQKLAAPELLVMVDCQYEGGNTDIFETKTLAVIDHHRVCTRLPELSKVDSRLGSCSTLIWKMLKDENCDIWRSRELSTALYYGLYCDTTSFMEISHPLDKELRDNVEFDAELITKYRNSNLSLEELEVAGAALLKTDYQERYRTAIVKAGPCDPNILGIISDLVLGVDAVDICIVFNVQPGGVKVSVRSCIKEVEANELAEALCEHIGSGGGHTIKAGGYIQMDLLSREYLRFCEENGFTPRMEQNADGRHVQPCSSGIKAVIEQRFHDYMDHADRRAAHPVKGKTVVVFDLDGTLLDTLEDLKEAVNFALRAEEMPECTLEQVRQYVGNGIRKLMVRAVPDGEGNPRFEAAFAAFTEYYKAHCLDNTKPYPDVMRLLEELKLRGIRTAIVSNKLDPAVKELHARFFKDCVQAAIGETAQIARKPAPDMVQQALQELSATPEEAVYVGDSDVDLQTAENAGLPCVSVTWGFRDEAFLREHGAKTLIQTPLELLNLL